MEPIDLWHSIIDAEAKFHNEHGKPPKVLILPILQAYDLRKLGRNEFPYSELLAKEGIRALEKGKILGGIKVKLVTDKDTFAFE
jgi:hypothetical protein